jgi:hypothetical protein
VDNILSRWTSLFYFNLINLHKSGNDRLLDYNNIKLFIINWCC